MGEPYHRMAADATLMLKDIRPPHVLSQPEKDAKRALVCALREHDLVTIVEYRTDRSRA